MLLASVLKKWKISGGKSGNWKGNIFFSHGRSHSRGVLLPVRDNLDFQLRSIKVDSQGRYVFLEVSIQDSPYFLLNIYAPNKCSEQCTFFKEISEILKAARAEQDYSIIVGGDFNVILDPDLDGRGGNNRKKDSAKLFEDMHLDFDLVDIWRIRNPTTPLFTWRQKIPVVRRRLDFWLINDSLQDEIISAEIETVKVKPVKEDQNYKRWKNVILIQIVEISRNVCEGILRYDECHNVLQTI